MAKKPKPPRGPQLELAGNLGIAFANTAGARDWNFQQGAGTYAELVIWGQQAGVLDAAAAERLRRLAAERPQDAEAVTAGAWQLRSSLSRVFLALARTQDPQPADFETLNETLSAALPALRVMPAESGWTWGWGGDEDALDRMLWPVAHSAAELLTSLDGKSYVRQCARKHCPLLFVTRRSQQKWCSATCRNRTKSLRYYFRHERERRDRRLRAGGLWRFKRPRKSKFS